MTKTIREQLQALVDELRLRLLDAELSDRRCVFEIPDLLRLKAILATEPPAVTVRKGWLAKDSAGVAWYAARPNPTADGDDFTWELSAHGICQLCDETGECITDPWPDHPNGGPECIMEVG